jgi:hypothetical protein
LLALNWITVGSVNAGCAHADDASLVLGAEVAGAGSLPVAEAGVAGLVVEPLSWAAAADWAGGVAPAPVVETVAVGERLVVARLGAPVVGEPVLGAAGLETGPISGAGLLGGGGAGCGRFLGVGRLRRTCVTLRVRRRHLAGTRLRDRRDVVLGQRLVGRGRDARRWTAAVAASTGEPTARMAIAGRAITAIRKWRPRIDLACVGVGGQRIARVVPSCSTPAAA